MAEQKETASPETKPEPWVGRLLREGELEDDSDRDVTSSDGSVLEEDAPEGKSGISLAVAAKQPSPKLYMHSSRIDVEAAEDEVARANRVKSLSGRVATIIAGPTRSMFIVHEGLASCLSEYFRGAFRGQFRESQQLQVELSDTSPKTVDIWMQWAYSDHSPRSSIAEEQRAAAARLYIRSLDDRFGYPDLLRFAKLYSLADYLGCKALMEDIELVTTMRAPAISFHPPGREAAGYIYSHFDKGHFLRGVMVREFRIFADHHAIEDAQSYPLELWSELAMKGIGHSQRQSWRQGPVCPMPT